MVETKSLKAYAVRLRPDQIQYLRRLSKTGNASIFIREALDREIRRRVKSPAQKIIALNSEIIALTNEVYRLERAQEFTKGVERLKEIEESATKYENWKHLLKLFTRENPLDHIDLDPLRKESTRGHLIYDSQRRNIAVWINDNELDMTEEGFTYSVTSKLESLISAYETLKKGEVETRQIVGAYEAAITKIRGEIEAKRREMLALKP